MHYDVFLYNIPKVSGDDKVVPVEGSQTQGFTALQEAQDFAAEKKGAFDRVVLMRTDDDGAQKMVERYLDGAHEPGKPDDAEPADES